MLYLPMEHSKIYVFGNPDLEVDSMPLKILPELKRKLPQIEFIVQDPNEELAVGGVGEELIVLDTALGISEVTIFDDLEKFQPPPRVSLHDFDALTNLRLLKKLDKIKEVKIIGIPSKLSGKQTLPDLAGSVLAALNNLPDQGTRAPRKTRR